MANIKIAQLTNKTSLADSDLVIVESATQTMKMTVDNLRKSLSETGTKSLIVSSSGGSLGSGTATCDWVKNGKHVTLAFTATITTNGSGSGFITLSNLPFVPISDTHGAGRNSSNGDMLQVEARSAFGGRIDVRKYDNSYPGANGVTLRGTVSYATNG